MFCSVCLLLTPSLRAQTVINSSTSSGSVFVGPVSGLGILSYDVTYQLVTCTETDPPQFYPSYQEWSYGNFVYVDGSGVSHAMSGGASYFSSDGDSPPCPGNYVGTGTLTGDDLTIIFVPDSNESGTATLQPISGHINPKYVVLAVTYAPPGSQSNVNYSESTLLGDSTSIANSNNFQSSIKVSIKATTGVATGIFGLQGSTTYSYSQGWINEQDTSSSISLNKTTQIAELVRGPSSSQGINHDYDVIWLWLNPLALYDVLPGPDSVTWTGYDYDATDMPDMDVYPVYVGYLNGHFAIPSDVATVLARPWATGQTWGPGEGPGLTAQDFMKILAADPFSNPTYTVSVPAGSLTTSDGRFTVTGNQNVSYVPPPPGGNPITQNYIEGYVTTTTQGQGSKQSLQVAWSLDQSLSVGFGKHFIASLTADTQYSRTQTWTYQWSTTRTNTTSQSASLSVTGPAASDNYTGPTEFVVFQDNIYGTFMFYPAR
jgi:hypothetical protein